MKALLVPRERAGLHRRVATNVAVPEAPDGATRAHFFNGMTQGPT